VNRVAQWHSGPVSYKVSDSRSSDSELASSSPTRITVE